MASWRHSATASLGFGTRYLLRVSSRRGKYLVNLAPIGADPSCNPDRLAQHSHGQALLPTFKSGSPFGQRSQKQFKIAKTEHGERIAETPGLGETLRQTTPESSLVIVVENGLDYGRDSVKDIV